MPGSNPPNPSRLFLPVIFPVATHDEQAKCMQLRGGQGLPVLPTHYTQPDQKVTSIIAANVPVTYFRFREKHVDAAEAQAIANVFENMHRVSGGRLHCVYIDNACPYKDAARALGYVEAPGTVWWKGL